MAVSSEMRTKALAKWAAKARASAAAAGAAAPFQAHRAGEEKAEMFSNPISVCCGQGERVILPLKLRKYAEEAEEEEEALEEEAAYWMGSAPPI